jgi:hypothetical protein
MCLRPQKKKKVAKNQIDSEEDTYESPRLIYCKDTDMLVPVVRTSIETTLPMPKPWSDSDEDTPIDVVESSMGVHNEIPSNL